MTRVETGTCSFAELTSQRLVVRPQRILNDMKQMGLILEAYPDSGRRPVEFLYRPESGVKLTLDCRVPKPQEIYRDVAYHRLDSLLGWGVSAPVSTWQLGQSDKGVIRPYWEDVVTVDFYQLGNLIASNPKFWLKAAALDYICAVVDRTANDVLIIDGFPLIVDSGLSFVEGEDFVCQNDHVRNELRGKRLDAQMISDLSQLSSRDINSAIFGLMPNTLFAWINRRIKRLVETRVIL